MSNNLYATRIRRARLWMRRRQFVSDNLDCALTYAASFLKMCGEGPKHNRSMLFAQMWFTDCPCCLFYRGMAAGVTVCASLVAFAWIVWAIIYGV